MEKLLTDGSLIPIMFTTWNRLEYTKKALKSVLENTIHPFALWIWDNNSTDGTIEYLKNIKDSRIRITFSSENLGLIPPMNEFLKWYPDAKYIAKVDNDMIVPKGWLTKLKNVMDNFPLFVLSVDHYLGLPYRLKNNQEFYDQLEKIEFEGNNLYLYPHSDGSGIIVRRKYIDNLLEEKKGTLEGWVAYQFHKCYYENLRCAFYSGVWAELLDFVDTNKVKNDYPEYSKKINVMRSGKEVSTGFGVMDLDLETLAKCRKTMSKEWR